MNYLKLKALAIYLNVGFEQIKEYSYYLYRYEYSFFAVLDSKEFNISDFKDCKEIKSIKLGGKEFYIYKYKYLSWNKEKDEVQLIM